MRLVFTLVFLALMVFFMIFAWQNQESEVSVNFGSWQSGTLPVFLVVLISFGAGVVITSIIGIIEGVRVRMANAKLRHKIKKLEGEVDALRNLPLTGPAAAPGGPDDEAESPDEEEIL
jgi:uncharacterized integral membrane protein